MWKRFLIDIILSAFLDRIIQNGRKEIIRKQKLLKRV